MVAMQTKVHLKGSASYPFVPFAGFIIIWDDSYMLYASNAEYIYEYLHSQVDTVELIWHGAAEVAVSTRFLND